jgi:ribosomal protein S18 acetylase RimI-like enzyme
VNGTIPPDPTPEWRLRDALRPGDLAAVRGLAEATGFFSAAEVAIAAELVEETLSNPSSSSYRFLLLEKAGTLLGYTCYGEIPGTIGSFDLYWLVVAADRQGQGLGRRLLEETEGRIAALGGRQLYAETSSRPQYLPTCGFYEATGFQEAARLPDYYAPGDSMIIYAKSLDSPAHSD